MNSPNKALQLSTYFGYFQIARLRSKIRGIEYCVVHMFSGRSVYDAPPRFTFQLPSTPLARTPFPSASVPAELDVSPSYMIRTCKFNSMLLIFSGISVIIAVEVLFPMLLPRLLAYTLCPICIILGYMSWSWTLEISDDGIKQKAMWKQWSYKWNEIDSAVIKSVDNGYNIKLVVSGGDVVVHTVFIDDQVVELIKKHCCII